MKQIVFVVADDVASKELYTYSLENEFECYCFDDGGLLFDALKKTVPDLILLDIVLHGAPGLPADAGFSILTRLKEGQSTARIPVIMVSAKGEEAFKVKSLNMGADDYITKPFSTLELVARM